MTRFPPDQPGKVHRISVDQLQIPPSSLCDWTTHEDVKIHPKGCQCGWFRRLVDDACDPARPCRSIRDQNGHCLVCLTLGVQDVGGHLLRAPMLAGPSGVCVPHPLVQGLAGMDGHAETRLVTDAAGLFPGGCHG